MAVSRVRSFWTNFAKGALSERVQSRPDLDAYQNAAAQLDNWRMLLEGGITRRPGTRYEGDLTSLSSVQLEAFVFNPDQAYLFVFANTTLDIYKENGDYVTQLTSAAWTTAMIGELRVSQAFDTMIVCHEDLATQKIVRTALDTFAISALSYETHSSGVPVYQPYYKYADETMTLTPSATTGSGITLTTSATHWVDPGHVGVKVRYKGKECTITSITSGTVAVADVDETLSGTTADVDWDEQAFSGVYGYPKIPMFFKQRLLFGGSKFLPHVLFGSKIEAFYNFDVGTGLDNESIFHAIYENQVGEITNMADAGNLIIMTDAGEYWNEISPANPFAPGNINFDATSRIGSIVASKEVYDKALLFTAKSGTSIRELRFSDAYQSYAANQIGTLSRDVVSKPTRIEILRESADASESYAVFLNDDGTLAIFHSQAQEDIGGWAKWLTPGDSGTDYIADVCAVDRALFIATSRTINGSAKIYLERFDYTTTLDCTINKNVGVTEFTQLFTNPADLSHADWVKTGVTIDTDAILDPDGGTTTADKMTEDSSTGDHRVIQTPATTVVNGTKYRQDWWVKVASGTRNVMCSFDTANFPANAHCFFDIVNGVIESQGAGLDSAEITAWANGWYQLRIEATADGSGSNAMTTKLAQTTTTSYTGDGTSGVYVYSPELSAAPLSVWTGLSVLEAATVHVTSSTFYIGSFDVASSQIDTDPFVRYDVEIGMLYTPQGKTLRPEVQLDDGPSHGELRRVIKATFDLESTLSLQVDVDDVLFVRDVDDDLSNDPVAFTGAFVAGGLDWGYDGTVTFTQDVPLQGTINSVVVEVMI